MWHVAHLRYLFDPLPPMALRPLRQLRLCAQPDLAREVPSLAERVAEVTRGWLLIGGRTCLMGISLVDRRDIIIYLIIGNISS